MSEEEKKLERKFHLKTAIKTKKELSRKLKEILKLCNRGYLEEYYENITDSDISNTTDELLVDMIYDKLTSKETIERFLNSLSYEEYKILSKIIDNDGLTVDDDINYLDYYYITNFGVVYKFNYKNKLYVIIPDELIDIIKKINLQNYKDITLDNSLTIDVANAMCNFYGAVPIEFLVSACETYYGITDLNFDCLLYAKRNLCICYKKKEEIYLFKETEEISNIYKIISNLTDTLCNFDFKILECEELIKYRNLSYYEKNFATENFAKYLKKHNLKDDIIKEIISNIVEDFKSDIILGISLLKHTLSEYNFVPNETDYDEFMTYINDIINNIPLWGNKGWTNKEIVSREIFT